MGDLNLWWDRYGLKLLALIAVALIIGAVYPQLASRSQNPSQLSAWDSDWNDLSRFAADMEARGYTTQSLLSSPQALGELTGEQRNSTVLVILVPLAPCHLRHVGAEALVNLVVGWPRLVTAGVHHVSQPCNHHAVVNA